MTKPFSYRGKIITASSKVEAIKKVVATKEEEEKAGKFLNNLEKALSSNFKNFTIKKRTKNNKKANYIFDTKEYKGLTLRVEYDFEKDKEDIVYYEYDGDVYVELDSDKWDVWSDCCFNGDEIPKIIKWIKSESKKGYQEEQKELEKKLKEKKKPAVKKPTSKPKYTNLHTYKSDLYDALTARGLNSEFAMDYVNGLDNYFMKTHQDIKLLVDEAVREWG